MAKEAAFKDDAIRQLADLLDEKGLNEIEYESDGSRIRVARHFAQSSSTSQLLPDNLSVENTSKYSTSPSSLENPEDLSKHPGVVKCPIVGTAYHSPNPEVPPFVKVGENVNEGQTLMIVEAMKVMNPIRSPQAGIVTHILVQNSDPVEFGQPLLIIE
jgi:acetyl-CoA carboxylase biotin carboxyl carrier protein